MQCSDEDKESPLDDDEEEDEEEEDDDVDDDDEETRCRFVKEGCVNKTGASSSSRTLLGDKDKWEGFSVMICCPSLEVINC